MATPTAKMPTEREILGAVNTTAKDVAAIVVRTEKMGKAGALLCHCSILQIIGVWCKQRSKDSNSNQKDHDNSARNCQLVAAEPLEHLT